MSWSCVSNSAQYHHTCVWKGRKTWFNQSLCGRNKCFALCVCLVFLTSNWSILSLPWCYVTTNQWPRQTNAHGHVAMVTDWRLEEGRHMSPSSWCMTQISWSERGRAGLRAPAKESGYPGHYEPIWPCVYHRHYDSKSIIWLTKNIFSINFYLNVPL